MQEFSVSSSILRNIAQTRNRSRNSHDNITERASNVKGIKENKENTSKIIIINGENKIKLSLEQSSSKQQVSDFSSTGIEKVIFFSHIH